MVDINLFKDDENQDDWSNTPDGGSGDNLDADLGGDLNFDDDFNDGPTLDDAALLGEEDAIPDFEEPEDQIGEEDYDFGEVKGKKTSPGIFVVLAIVIVGAVYVKFIMPAMQKKKVKPTARKRPVAARITQNAKNQGQQKTTTGADVSQTAQKSAGQAATKQGTATPGTVVVQSGKTIPVFIHAGRSIFNDLSSQGQLGTIVIDGNHFNIGYVSSTPNAAQTVGKRIQQLLGISTFKTSPEDRHRTAGKVNYWGVISGKFSDGSVSVFKSTGKQFASSAQFSEELNTLAKNHGVSVSQTQTFSQRTDGGKKYIPVHIKFHGSKTQLMNFMSALNTYQGNYGITKLTIAPVNISDFKAEQAKLLLEFWVYSS